MEVDVYVRFTVDWGKQEPPTDDELRELYIAIVPSEVRVCVPILASIPEEMNVIREHAKVCEYETVEVSFYGRRFADE